MTFLDDNTELFVSPLSSTELKRAHWYFEHRAQLERYLIAALIVLDVIFLLTAGWGAVRFFSKPSASQIVRELSEPGIPYESFRITLEPRPLVIRNVSTVAITGTEQDLIAEIVNPNSGWLARQVVLQFTTASRVLAPLETFFLPDEARLVPLERAKGVNRGDRVSVIINRIEWQRVRGAVALAPFVIGAAQVATLLTDTNNPITSVSVPVTNKGSRGFWRQDFLLVVQRGEQLLGVRQVTINQFKSGSSAVITARWPGRFPPDATVAVTPVFNPFAEENLLPLDLDR